MLQVIPKPHPWMPACAGMTLLAPIVRLSRESGNPGSRAGGGLGISSTQIIMGPLLIVDGFNVLHAGVLVGRDRADWWKAAAQQRLVERVERFTDTTYAEIWIIFDRRPDRQEASVVTSTDARITVSYAPSADDWIVEQVRVLSPQRSVTIVTADRPLRERARRVGAALSSPQQFLSACG